MSNQTLEALAVQQYGNAPQLMLVTTMAGKKILLNPQKILFVEKIKNENAGNGLYLKFERGEKDVPDIYISVRGTMDSYVMAIRTLRLNPGRPAIRLDPDWTFDRPLEDLNDVIPDEQAVKA